MPHPEPTPPAFDGTELARTLRAGVPIADRTYRLRTYPRCFVGAEDCAWMVERGLAADLD